MDIYYNINQNNYIFENPIPGGNVLHYGAGYDPEVFYLIDFYNIADDTYYISSYGRVFNIVTMKERKPVKSNTNYYDVQLKLNDGTDKQFRVHRLVAMAFIPRTHEDIVNGRDFVNHKNLQKTFNYYGNLEWVTNEENIHHANVNNARERHHIWFDLSRDNSKIYGAKRITDEQVHTMCRCISIGKSKSEALAAAGLENTPVNISTLCNIIAGRRRVNISSQYDFSNVKSRQCENYTEHIIKVCELLEQGYRIKDICDMLDISDNYDKARMFVSGIKNHKTYTNISCNYNF